jgi:hypothetical protein
VVFLPQIARMRSEHRRHHEDVYKPVVCVTGKLHHLKRGEASGRQLIKRLRPATGQRLTRAAPLIVRFAAARVLRSLFRFADADECRIGANEQSIFA